jgi:DNA-binding transcriptional LysR family regulator
MEDLNDLALFAKVVEHKGFSAAGKQLGIPKSRLSRHIARLEARLGVRLLQRTSRRLTVTSVGQLFYERCQAVVAMGESARDVIHQAVSEPQGPLRVSCPITLAQFWLTPLLPEFMKIFPKVRLLLSVTNRRIDPVEEQVDVVLRVRRPPFDDSSLVVRRLGQTTDVLVASPSLLAFNADPVEPRDLAGWPTLSVPSDGERQTWTLKNATTVSEIAHEPRLATADMFALKRAALEGVGLTLLPEIICRDELQNGQLRRVLPEWSCAVSEIQAAFPTRRGMLPAVRALVDFLSSHPPGIRPPYEVR